MLTVYGVKAPEPKTEEELNRFLRKKELRLDNNYTVTGEYWEKKLSDTTDFPFPTVAIFDKNKKFISYYNETKSTCSGGIPLFIENLDKTKTIKNTTNPNFEDIFFNLRSFKGEDISFDTLQEGDFYIFAYWASFFGKLNNGIKDWETAAQSNTNADIVFIKVNFDIHPWWNSKYLEKVKIEY
jgi:hypothetical protein